MNEPQKSTRHSYSHRGGFYTLPSLAQFDEQGLWMARGAWFSKHGTLLGTTEALVREGTAGYHASELEARLHVPVKEALRQLVEDRRIHRSEHAGLYLYTAPSRQRRQEQMAARRALVFFSLLMIHDCFASHFLFAFGLSLRFSSWRIPRTKDQGPKTKAKITVFILAEAEEEKGVARVALDFDFMTIDSKPSTEQGKDRCD